MSRCHRHLLTLINVTHARAAMTSQPHRHGCMGPMPCRPDASRLHRFPANRAWCHEGASDPYNTDVMPPSTSLRSSAVRSGCIHLLTCKPLVAGHIDRLPDIEAGCFAAALRPGHITFSPCRLCTSVSNPFSDMQGTCGKAASNS